MATQDVMEMPPQLLGLRKPDDIIDEAKERANKLKQIVKETHVSVDIGGKEHLMFEAWATIGSFYGCTAGAEDAVPVEIDGVRGFKAKARVINERTGQFVSEAIAYCMRDEENWEEKPTFQLASMAQTRAMSKALASKFRWVVVLAGYQGTPSEEMPSSKTASPVLFPFPSEKGKPLNEVSDEGLAYWMGRITTDLGKPDFKYREKSKREQKAVKDEQERRLEAGAQPEEEFDRAKSRELDAKLAKDGR